MYEQRSRSRSVLPNGLQHRDDRSRVVLKVRDRVVQRPGHDAGSGSKEDGVEVLTTEVSRQSVVAESDLGLDAPCARPLQSSPWIAVDAGYRNVVVEQLA